GGIDLFGGARLEKNGQQGCGKHGVRIEYPAMRVISFVALFAAIAYPVAEKHPVVQHYGDTAFTDNYQWLENAADPKVQAWVKEENALTRATLDAVPARAAIAAKLTALYKAPRLSYSRVIVRGGKLFALKSAPPKEQPQLVVLDNPNDAKSERVLYDPTRADAKGGIAMDFFEPSRDAKRIAISLSLHGSEEGSVHVFDVATGKETGDVVPRVNGATAGGSVAWNADGSGFWYTRY